MTKREYRLWLLRMMFRLTVLVGLIAAVVEQVGG